MHDLHLYYASLRAQAEAALLGVPPAERGHVAISVLAADILALMDSLKTPPFDPAFPQAR